MQRITASILFLQLQMQVPVIGIELIVQHIENSVTVNGDQAVPCRYLSLQRRSIINFFYLVVLHK